MPPTASASISERHCFTCHGRVGQGGAYNGPAPILAKTALPFDGFKGQIRNPTNDMPAYSDAVLSDQAGRRHLRLRAHAAGAEFAEEFSDLE